MLSYAVVKHAGSGRARKKCREKHETKSSVFPQFLSAAKLSLSRCFREKNDAFKVRFFNSLTRLIRIQRQIKVSSPEEFGRIVAHENVLFSYGN